MPDEVNEKNHLSVEEIERSLLNNLIKNLDKLILFAIISFMLARNGQLQLWGEEQVKTTSHEESCSVLTTSPLTFQCIVCEKNTIAPRYLLSKRVTCSNKCRGILMSRVNRGAKNPRWKGGRVLEKCLFCQGEFSTKRDNHNHAKFCSKNCWRSWLKKSGSRKGSKNPMYGKKRGGSLSPNWEGGEITKKCIICNASYSVPKYKKDSAKFCSYKCMGKWQSVNKSGENSNFWKGGITSELHKRISRPEWKKLRKEIYLRDNWTCQICQKHCHKDIQCHHKIPYRVSKNDNPNNLITLCRSCHAKEDAKYGRF